jgi:hypothetical protein
MTEDGAPRFTRSNILKLDRLLNMWYKPAEIAEEIGISVDTIYRTHLQAGCPHKRDDHNQIWICGSEFATWARSVAKEKKAFKLEEGQAWCVHCNQVVELVGGRERSVRRNLKIVQGKCAVCGGKVNRLKSGKEKG